MSIVIAPVVEGRGETEAVPVLVRRIAQEMCGTHVTVVHPWRLDSGRMRRNDELANVVRVQATRIIQGGGVLIVRDGDDKGVQCPLELATSLARAAQSAPVPVEIVIAWREFEAWLLASMESLRAHPLLRDDAAVPDNPEARRDAKGVLSSQMTETYRETRHQVKLTAAMDLTMASSRSRSFQRMVHAVQRLLSNPASQ